MQEIRRQRNSSSKTPKTYLRELIQIAAVKSISDERIADYCIGLLTAAPKNVAIAAAQLLLFLLQSPQSLQKAIEEADSRELHGNVIDGSNSFLSCCVLETLRLTSHAIGSVRKTQKDYDIENKYVLPPGSFVGASHLLMAMDSQQWKLPFNFLPERHLPTSAVDIPQGIAAPSFKARKRTANGSCASCTSEDASYDRSTEVQSRKKRSGSARFKFSLIPFSWGAHRCPGSKIAMYMIRELLFHVLAAYHCTTCVDYPLSELNFEKATLAQRQQDCIIALQKRTLKVANAAR